VTSLTQQERASAIREVRALARQLDEAGRIADEDTLGKAATIAALRDDPAWVQEWQQEKPAKPDAVGRMQADSTNRFVQWLRWKVETESGPALPQPVVARLLTAHEICRYTSGIAVKPTTEGIVRPLSWLLKGGRADDIGEVWARAVELADGAPTERHVREALREKRATLTPSQIRAAITTKRARTHRYRAQAAVETLLGDGDQAEVEAFHAWYRDTIQRLNERVALKVAR
jgi:hypothetical protein